MEGLRSRVMKWSMMSMLVMLLVLSCVESRQAVLHRVGGGRMSWTHDVNFTDWSTKEHFYVGDWLYFGFDKFRFSVLEVNKIGYDHCIDKGFIYNVTRGGRDVFNLTEAKTYYFLSGRGYCHKGMKVAVCVEDSPPELHLRKNHGFVASSYTSTNFIIVLAMIVSSAFMSY